MLIDTLNSLLSGSIVPNEIIIVDQSNPRLNLQNNYSNTEIIIIYSSIPSLIIARNVGLHAAKNDVVLFCDDDIFVNKQSLELLWNNINTNTTALVTALNKRDNILFSDIKQSALLKDILSSFVGMKSLLKHRSESGGYIIKSGMRGRYAFGINHLQNTTWAMGFFFCIKKSLAEEWNVTFDENLIRYAYAEDLDFSLRYCSNAKKNMLKTIIVPKIYVNHLASQEWRIPSVEATFYFIANRRYLSYKNYKREFWYRWSLEWYDSLFSLSQFKTENIFLN